MRLSTVSEKDPLMEMSSVSELEHECLTLLVQKKAS